ncbi:MAG: hypothetical protein KDD19_26955 [Phaeodactylibacter sp.]|nr:hypothetical protein [Phaeodactylibacter sp.]MCB9048667.1 hypothetical protein [Lewinellaceae bacterium]
MKHTAQILALYFLFGSLIPGSDFSQLKRAPAVWEHYQVHQSLSAGSGEKASFFEFLYTHFWDTNSHQHNDGGQSHQDLPLKTVHIFSPILLAGTTPLVLAALPHKENRAILHYNAPSSAPHEGAVFRPPIVS